MNVQELSNLFDTLLQPYITKDVSGEQNTLAFDEYEKSIFLTKAQEQIVLELYQELEQSEENRKYLSNLIKTGNYVPVGEQDETLINNTFKSYKVVGILSLLKYDSKNKIPFNADEAGSIDLSISNAPYATGSSSQSESILSLSVMRKGGSAFFQYRLNPLSSGVISRTRSEVISASYSFPLYSL